MPDSKEKQSKEVVEEEEKFSVSSLRKASWQLFGVYGPVFITSVVYAKLAEEDMVTKSTMKKHIDDYLNHPVPR